MGKIANYDSMIYRNNTVIAKSTTIPTNFSPYKLMLPKTFDTYQRGLYCLQIQSLSGHYQSNIRLEINNEYVYNNFSFDDMTGYMWILYFIIDSMVFYTISMKSEVGYFKIIMPFVGKVPTTQYFPITLGMSSDYIQSWNASMLIF